MAKSKKSKPNGKYPLITVYGNFFMWSEDKIDNMKKKASELEAPKDTVFIAGKTPVTRSKNIWAPSLLELLNKEMPV